MVQVILNGESIGHIAGDNLRIFLRTTKMVVVSQTQYTINLETVK